MTMKNKIQELYTKAIYEDLPPNVFADQVLRLFGVSGSLPFNAIINPHYDRNGFIDGGLIISNGEIIGHADPKGEQGAMGEAGRQ